MPRQQKLKLTIPLPEGVPLTQELEAQALAAVSEVFSELKQTAELAKKLEQQGYHIGVEELLQSKKQTSQKKTTAKKIQQKSAQKPAANGKGKRVVLSAAQKKKVVELLKQGNVARVVAEKYGVSTATINNLKREAGLTKPSPAQEKLFAQRKNSLVKKNASDENENTSAA